jgi:hypothetical protein
MYRENLMLEEPLFMVKILLSGAIIMPSQPIPKAWSSLCRKLMGLTLAVHFLSSLALPLAKAMGFFGVDTSSMVMPNLPAAAKGPVKGDDS